MFCDIDKAANFKVFASKVDHWVAFQMNVVEIENHDYRRCYSRIGLLPRTDYCPALPYFRFLEVTLALFGTKNLTTLPWITFSGLHRDNEEILIAYGGSSLEESIRGSV